MARGDMQFIRQHDLVESPWENGGGITRNIAQEEDASGPLWRLSMADVDREGGFSSFPRLIRILTVIKGDGLVLHGPDGAMMARHAVPVTFDGAMPIIATLSQGPIRGFNLMFDAERCVGEAHVAREAGSSELGQVGRTDVLHLIAGNAQVEGIALQVGDTAISKDRPLCLDLAHDAIALAITLRCHHDRP
ncbi:hypothetical protein CUR85_05365 [Sulfitobacter faviae]|nr:hypothetical protein [Sulfitobacter faviae]